MQPQISILVPTYNRRDLLLQTLNSIIAQSYHNFEIIITDNCSTDGTTEAVASIEDSRINYIRNEINVGAVNNYNKAMRAAKGNFIYFFSDDDIMLPDNLLRKLQVFEQHPSVGLVHSNFHRIDTQGTVTNENHWAASYPQLADIYQEISRQPLMSQARAFEVLYYKWTFISMPTVMVRAAVLRENVLELSSQLNYLCDWDLWLKIALKTNFYYLTDPLVLYRTHQSNEGKMMTSQVYYRELILSKLGTVNQFKINYLQGRNELQQIERLVKQQLKRMKFYETSLGEQYRYLRGYLKRVLPVRAVEALKSL